MSKDDPRLRPRSKTAITRKVMPNIRGQLIQEIREDNGRTPEIRPRTRRTMQWARTAIWIAATAITTAIFLPPLLKIMLIAAGCITLLAAGTVAWRNIEEITLGIQETMQK